MRQQAGRYTIRGQLGRGAMGIVYLAEDPLLNRHVAIKTIDLAVDDASEREFFRDRLLRDARAAAALSHPNIVSVYDILEEGNTAYMVMEYIAGESLAARLKASPPPDRETILQMLRQMAAALDYTHSRGVVHRDVKPANVMIDGAGVAKIMDFGIARINDTRTVTPTGMVMGTADYMSPEQIKGDIVDGRADQFALAAVAYQMLTGNTLFGQHALATLTYKIVNEMPRPATAWNSELPEAVDGVLMKALAKTPGLRYPTCSQFIDSLSDALSNGAVEALPPTVALAATAAKHTAPPVPTGSGSGKRMGLAAGLGVIVLGGGLVVWQPWTKPQSAGTESKQAKTGTEKPSKADDSAKPDANVPMTRGQEQMKAGDYRGAVESFTDAIARHPKSAQAYASRGSAHERLDQNNSAVEDFSEAIRLAPKEAFAYAGRGICLVRLRQDEDALRDFNRALDLDPNLASALNGRGGVYFRRHRYDKASRDFDAAISVNPRLAQAYLNRAHLRKATGDSEGAAADLKMGERIKGQDKD